MLACKASTHELHRHKLYGFITSIHGGIHNIYTYINVYVNIHISIITHICILYVYIEEKLKNFGAPAEPAIVEASNS